MNAFEITSGILGLGANIVLALAYFFNLRKINKELKEARIVVGSTTELREALRKPLEGIWQVSGKFNKLRGNEDRHESHGFVIFYWDHTQSRYDVIDTYSVRKAFDSTDLATVLCQGHGSADKNGFVSKEFPLKLSMRILSSSTTHESVNFSIQASQWETSSEGKITKLTFDFRNGLTEGVINFTR